MNYPSFLCITEKVLFRIWQPLSQTDLYISLTGLSARGQNVPDREIRNIPVSRNDDVEKLSKTQVESTLKWRRIIDVWNDVEIGSKTQIESTLD